MDIRPLGARISIDIRATNQDTIFAFAPGQVVSSKNEKRGYGNYIIIKHADGLETCYAHNSINFVQENETVTAGQPIGMVGNTGRSTEDHLHFEIRKEGVPVNPLDMFDDKQTDK